MKILLAEDEAELATSIASYLASENYVCEVAATVNEAYDKICLFDYDCILLDTMLPGGDGLKLLEELKKEKKQDDIIIISAKDSFEDKFLDLKLEQMIIYPNLFNQLSLYQIL